MDTWHLYTHSIRGSESRRVRDRVPVVDLAEDALGARARGLSVARIDMAIGIPRINVAEANLFVPWFRIPERCVASVNTDPSTLGPCVSYL